MKVYEYNDVDRPIWHKSSSRPFGRSLSLNIFECPNGKYVVETCALIKYSKEKKQNQWFGYWKNVSRKKFLKWDRNERHAVGGFGKKTLWICRKHTRNFFFVVLGPSGFLIRNDVRNFHFQNFFSISKVSIEEKNTRHVSGVMWFQKFNTNSNVWQFGPVMIPR